MRSWTGWSGNMANQGSGEMKYPAEAIPIRCLLHRLPLILALMLLISCGQGNTPEEQVRMFVKAGEEAVEARELGSVGKLISDQYLDKGQRTKRDIVALMARYLYVNKNIHLLTRLDQLDFPAQTRRGSISTWP